MIRASLIFINVNNELSVSLKSGKSKAVVSSNIKTEMKAGKGGKGC